MKFPQPWQLHQTGPIEYAVSDARRRKLFYIVADMGGSGEYDDAEPGMPAGPTLFGSSDDATATIVNKLRELLEGEE